MLSSKSLIIHSLLIAMLHFVPSTSFPRATENQNLNQNPPSVDLWSYFKHKYSSGDSFSAKDVNSMIKSLQNCDLLKFAQLKNSSSQVFETAPLPVQKFLRDIIDLKNEFNSTSFYSACPSILYLIDNKDFCDFETIAAFHQTSQELRDENLLSTRRGGYNKPSSGEVWGYATLFVTLISMCSLAGVSVMPVMGKAFYKHLLTCMVGLAVGSLTGSALFHLLPQAYGLTESDPNHGYLEISLVACGGIWMFFMVERILKFLMDYKDRKDNKTKGEKISHLIPSTPDCNSMSGRGSSNGTLKELNDRNNISSICSPANTGVIYESQEQAIKASFGHPEKPRHSSCHDHKITFDKEKDSVIATVAWMIIFGDGLHNFIDGLSIGAGFNESILTGVSISVAVLCEELPHELGDFAVLLNAGMSIKQALTYNFLSACTCYLGMAVGILLGEVEASTYIFAVAGGMFLYIALVDMVPEMNEIAVENSKISVKKGMHVLLLQNIGLFLGIFTLFFLAKYQDNIQF